MKPGLLLIAVFISIFVLLAMNFGSCSPTQVTLSASCDDFMKLQPDSVINKQVEVPLNGALKVDLCSNPSTGFKWSESAQISNTQIMKQTGHLYKAPESNDKVGAPGTDSWLFRAQQAGTCTITNEYGQPWQGGTKSSWKYVITVTVK